MISFPSQKELQEWISRLRQQAIRKSRVSRNQNFVSANLEKWSCGCYRSNDGPRSSAVKHILVQVLSYLVIALSRRSEVIEMRSLDDFWRSAIADFDNVIDVITHRHEQIEKQFAPILHFHLHGSAPLKSLTTSDDQC